MDNFKDILNANKIIKNYLILCSLFNWKPTKGKGRQYQFKELSRYCTWHKEGHKIIIDEIYDEPLEKVDGRKNTKGNNTKYGTLMDNLIIDTLVDFDGALEDSFSNLMIVYFQIFEKEYGDLFDYDFCENNDVTPAMLRVYTTYTWSTLYQLFITSLNRLRRQGVIRWEQNYFCREQMDEYVSDQALTEEIKQLDKEACKYYKIHPVQKREYSDRIKKYVLARLSNPKIWTYYKIYFIELINKDIEIEDYDIQELKRLLRTTITKKIKNKSFKVKSEDGEEEIVFPYDNWYQEGKIRNIHNLIFGIPDDVFSNVDEVS